MNERTNQPKTFEEWQREYLKSNHDFYLRLPSEQDRIIWAAAQAEIAGLRETDQQEIGRLGTELVGEATKYKANERSANQAPPSRMGGWVGTSSNET